MSADDADGARQEDEPLLSVEDLEVHFDQGGIIEQMLSETKVRAVDGVSFALEENDVLVLVGESGCGKTTLGKAAIGLQRPTGGTVRYRGQDVWAAKDDPTGADVEWREIRRALQIIHQDPESALNTSRRVRSILADPLKKWRPELGPQERTETIHRYLEYVDMVPTDDYGDRYPHQLSGGEKQRITLGRALMMNPDVIMADEAVSALDVSMRVDMMDLMLELQEMFDTSYLFISHDLANARYLAKRAGGKIAVMYLGEIVEIGDPDELLANPTHPYTQVLRWSTPAVDPEIARRKLDERPPVRKVDVPDPANPPMGCKFHPRCEQAREICSREAPELYDAESTEAACFRAVSTHEYWRSAEIEGERAGVERGLGDD